jgi:hypothetical protein
MDDPGDHIRTFLDGVQPDRRRRDAAMMRDLMTRVTAEPPRLWGSIIGFGRYHYKYKSGREGEAGAAGFAPRAATTIYPPDGTGRYREQLEHLGPHTASVGCTYISDLSKINLSVLEAIVAQSYRTVTSDTYRLRAREGGHQAQADG